MAAAYKVLKKVVEKNGIFTCECEFYNSSAVFVDKLYVTIYSNDPIVINEQLAEFANSYENASNTIGIDGNGQIIV